MTDTKSISIIIPNYNGRNLLEKNLPHVFEAVNEFTKKHRSVVEIIVTDDGSNDDSVSFLQEYRDEQAGKHITLRIVENKKNLGFSSTVNHGVKEAQGELIILLNTDVRPEKQFLFSLIKHFDDEQVFAVGCLDKSIEQGKTVLRGRGIGDWQKGFLMHHAGELNKTTTLWVSGGSGVFRKKIWEKLGGMNSLYNPFYWEDIDLSYRAQKAGYTVLFEGDSCVIHEHEEGTIRQSQSEKHIQEIAYRNQFYFVWINATDGRIIREHILWLPYHMLSALLRRDTAFFTGFISALLHFPQVLFLRSQNKPLFVRSDEDVISSLKE